MRCAFKNKWQYLLISLGVAVCLGCNDSSSAKLRTEEHSSEWANIDGVSLSFMLNSQSNLFQGRLVEKRIKELKFQPSDFSNETITGIILLFQRDDGKYFLAGTSNASKNECDLAAKLVEGKFYCIPEDFRRE